MLKTLLKYLSKHDILNIIFLFVITSIIIFNSDEINSWFVFAVINILLFFSICGIIIIYERKSFQDRHLSSVFKILRFWYPIIMIMVYFKEIYVIMNNVNDILYDDILIKIDYYLFGFHPTQVLQNISNPLLTEFLQLIYTLFYLIPVIYGLELYLWHRYKEFEFAVFLILLGFYLSFFGYLIIPAIGPRFTIHSFSNINIDLPGLVITEILRDIINYGESIFPKNIPYPEKIAQRDAFPSGHTIIILLVTYLSGKFKSNSFYFYLPFSVLMIFSTIYLRYHYVIDLIAGFCMAIVSVFISGYFYKNEFNKGDIIRST